VNLVPRPLRRFSLIYLFLVLPAVLAAGCGTTRTSHTSRTATEQLLISDAVDRAVDQIDVTALGGESVYLDTSALASTQDRNYIVSTLRQHLLANGVTLKDNLSESDIVVEARAGAVGTGGSELIYGVPAMNLPTLGPFTGVPSSLPEIPFIKRTDQQGVAKLSVFAFERETGEPIWQSGQSLVSTNARDLWILGAGPFQGGTLYEGDSNQVRLQLAPNPVTMAAGLFQKKKALPHRSDPSTMTVLKEKYFSGPAERLTNSEVNRGAPASLAPPHPVVQAAEWLPPVDETVNIEAHPKPAGISPSVIQASGEGVSTPSAPAGMP
jgi:hypothetical protein